MNDKALDTYLRKTYNITLEFYNALLRAQDGRCYVCRRRPARVRLGVDHDHRTGEVRGLLCVRSHRDWKGRDFPACNRIIGMARDNPAFFERAAEYLREPPARRLVSEQELAVLRDCSDVADLTDDDSDDTAGGVLWTL